jgi:hypothetical protein
VQILDEAAEILAWVDAAEFARLDQGEKNSVDFGAPLRVSSVPSLSADHWASQLAFLGVVVDGHITIRDKVR